MGKKSILLIAGIVVALIILFVCFGTQLFNKSIVGTWTYDGIAYSFSEDGTGEFKAIGNVSKFTYTTEQGIIKFQFEGSDEVIEVEYRMKNGHLCLIDQYGAEVQYDNK